MTTLVLDRTAIDRLLAVDDGFKVELTNSVVSHIARKFFEKDAARIISGTQPELFAKAMAAMQADGDLTGFVHQALTAKLVRRDSAYYSKLQLTPETKVLVEGFITDAMTSINTQIRAEVDKVVQSTAEKIMATQIEDLDQRIAKRVDTITSQYITEKVKEGVAAKVAAINEALK